MTQAAAPVDLPVGAERIAAILPHRYPFLLVDRVIALEPGKRITALKNVTTNEPFFQGHFPGHPVMPGVLIVEALAQASGLLIGLSETGAQNRGKLFYLAKVDNARFNRPVCPGDQLRLEVQLKRLIRGMGIFIAQAVVGEQEVASCELMCAERNA